MDTNYVIVINHHGDRQYFSEKTILTPRLDQAKQFPLAASAYIFATQKLRLRDFSIKPISQSELSAARRNSLQHQLNCLFPIDARD